MTPHSAPGYSDVVDWFRSPSPVSTLSGSYWCDAPHPSPHPLPRASGKSFDEDKRIVGRVYQVLEIGPSTLGPRPLGSRSTPQSGIWSPTLFPGRPRYTKIPGGEGRSSRGRGTSILEVFVFGHTDP